jgi:hypothetical protein
MHLARYAVTLLGIGLAAPSAAQLHPGSYGPAHLSVAGDSIFGVYNQRIGIGSTEIACIFLFRGAMTGDHAEVQAWLPGLPETAGATLRSDGRGGFVLRMNAEMPGCAMAAGGLSRAGERLDLSERHSEWIDMGVATVKTVMLVTGTGRAKRRSFSLARYTPVAVVAVRGDRLLIRVLGQARALEGWVEKGAVSLASANN